MQAIELISKRGYSGGVVVDSPHSGRDYPADFGYACAFDTLRLAEDLHVDALVRPLAASGADVVIANFPRSYIDVNRARDDFDARLIDGAIDSGSIYVKAGVGLIHRDVRAGQAIYNRKLTMMEIAPRLALYDQYYETLSKLMAQPAPLLYLNVHSMPSATAPCDKAGKPFDIILGNKDGRTASAEVMNWLKTCLSRHGYRVGCNNRYKGGNLVHHFGSPHIDIHAIQIEINRALYVDEWSRELTSGVARITQALDDIIMQWRAQTSLPLAAE